MMLKTLLFSSFMFFLLNSQGAWAACGANTRTWQADAGSTAWNTNNNWTPRNRPNAATENAVIVSDWYNPTYPNNNYSLGCVEIQSGLMTVGAANRLTIVGDYFRNLNLGSLVVPGGSTWEVIMQASANQSFENVDSIPRLRINNSETVFLTESFDITNRFLIDAGTGTVIIEKNLILSQTANFTIQPGTNVIIAAGGSLKLAGDLSINGTLTMETGSKLIMANGRTITIGAAGTLDINGVSGDAVTITTPDTSANFSFVSNGSFDAQYLVLSNMTTTGLNLNANVSRFDSISINSIPSGGRGLTIGASATLPASMDSVGFFTDGTGGPFTNVNASAYSSTVSTFTNWSGIGGTPNEVDGNNVINWGGEATPRLQVQNVSASGVPPATIGKGVAATHFATFAFSMSGTAAFATDVTQLILTLNGTNVNSDVSSINVYNDTNNNCVYNAGTDTLIGNYTPGGTPGRVTVNLASSEINVIDSTQDCLHVFIATSAAATTDNTVGIKISSTDDVTNSQAYLLSDTTGPPVTAGLATITGSAIKKWNGGYGTNMFTGANWTPSGVPNSTFDCEIGNGYSNPVMSGAFNCLNTRFQSSGQVNWNNSTNIFNVYGSFTVESGFVYQNSNNARITLRGANNQSVNFDGTTFPNDLTVNSSATVIFEDSGTISGNLTLQGGITKIANGAILTIGGNVTVASGATLDIDPGGELILGNGASITVASGGIIEMVGSVSQSASIKATNDASRYQIVVNNGATIRARYYSLRNLGSNGLTINASSTIDATNHLQDGNFTYPGINNANLLRLFREIPGDALVGMTFDSSGSGATGVISVYTNVGGSTDTLTLSGYAGDLTGASFTNDNTYLVSWGLETNELKLTQEATAPASSDQGEIVTIGSFGFQQLNAGAFNNTDITGLRVTLTGTGSASDVDSVSLYYDSACSGSGGTLIGSLPFSGSPARAEFLGIVGATVQADVATPPKRCFNVVYAIDALATNDKTVGAEIASSTHVTNSEGYSFNASFAPPVNVGETTIVGVTTQWTGATNTDWYTAGNWSSGVPTAGLNCVINDQANDPVIGSGTAVCKAMSIGNGSLTISGGSLQLYGSLESTGTLTASVPVVMRDDGTTPTSQNIDITSPLSTLQFNKTAGGSININSTVDVTNAVTLSPAQDFILNITANNTLICNGGLTVSGAEIDMKSGSELHIGSGQSLTINGGTFKTSGVNDPYPQSLVNKAHITNTGGTGTWSFTATSGAVDLTGFYIDWLDTNGLNFSGSVALDSLSGGQLRNLPASAGMRALQINTSGSIPSTASNFGWNWGPDNSNLAEGTSYFLAHSTGCGSQTIDFDQWFGDFWPYTTASTSDKISSSSCTILIDRAKSPVSLTRLEATPYDSKVIVEWTTGNEWDHRGFNVYRSLNPNDSFVQINKELIRNDIFSTSIHGTYAFIDEGVSNDVTYYYMIEDLSLMNESTLHGPLAALPMASLGNPPAIQAGTIVSSGDDTGTGQGDNTGGEAIEISENVWILSQTSNYFRLKVTVPGLTTADDPLNTSYKKLSIDGYSPATDAGKPELLTKTIMLKVGELSTQPNWSLVSENSTNINPVAVTPAPHYQNVSGTMTAQWMIDNAFYAVDQAGPNDRVRLGSVVELNNQYFLPITIQPLRYNPVQDDIDKLDELIFDVHLQGQAPWSQVDSSKSPWAREGTLKIGLLKEGMYQITYDQLDAAGVIAPFDNVDVDHMHLMITGAKIGLKISSVTGQFQSGDSFKFYAPSLNSDEDLRTFAALYVDGNEATATQADIDSAVTTEPLTDRSGFWTKRLYEENNLAVFNEPFTEETDHFVWSMIYGVSGGAKSPLEFDIDLPYLNQDSDVVLRLVVKSRRANSINTNHNLEVYINANESLISEASFQAVESKVLSFTIQGSEFVSGKNKIKLVASGDNLPAGEYDMLYIDRAEVYFSQEWTVEDDQALVLDQKQNQSFKIDGFQGADIEVYDVSNPTELYQLSNLESGAGDIGSYVRFATKGSSQGRRLWVGRSGAMLQATSYGLISGSDLRNSQNQGDVLYIGQRELLAAVEPLAKLRQNQGFKTKSVSLESIYNEFGLGASNVAAIKDFLNAAQSWAVKPRYVILLGDGTYDPKAFQNSDLKYRFPVKYIKGSSFDYVSDHWFVANEQGLPDAVIGRIPAKTPADLDIYVQKVLGYESGERKPRLDQSFEFFSDKAANTGEDFASPINAITGLSGIGALKNPKNHTRRSNVTDGEFKNEIQQAFSNSSIVHYMGHGAENMWADASVFNNTDVSQLSNAKLPVVIAMNCLNAQYSDPDLDSFAEKLIFNKQGGAIVFWGSTSFTPPSIQKIYQESFYANLASGEYGNLGDLVKMSKIQAGLSSPFDEILYSWSIIGDPMVKLSVEKAANTPVEQAPDLTQAPSSGGGGCSANANVGAYKHKTPWDLVFGFFLEVMLALFLLRLVFRTNK